MARGGTLTDRTGAAFPLLCAHGCRSEIQNSKALYLADKPQWKECGLTWARLRFTTETAEEALDILRRYQGEDFPPPQTSLAACFTEVSSKILIDNCIIII